VNDTLVQAGYPMYCEPLAKDVASLRSIGGDFCTSYLGYSPSAVVSTVTETPAVSTVQATTLELTTEISTGGSWKTWSQTFTPRSGVENLDLNLGLSLACQWYSQVDILVKDFSVRASST
jgi:hypothetical protein